MFTNTIYYKLISETEEKTLIYLINYSYLLELWALYQRDDSIVSLVRHYTKVHRWRQKEPGYESFILVNSLIGVFVCLA